MTDTITADALIRNDRVVLDPNEMPYLVDSVEGHGSTVYVTFSSGDERVYRIDENVTIVD